MAKRVTLLRSVAMTCSAVVLPMPGSVVSHLASCRWMASAISLIGRPRRLDRLADSDLVHRAEQLKEVEFDFVQEADPTRNKPAAVPTGFQIFDNLKGDLLAGTELDQPPDELRDQHLIFERPDLEADLLLENSGNKTCHLGDHAGTLDDVSVAVRRESE